MIHFPDRFQSPLIKTKLSAPQPRTRLVLRPRLLDLLADTCTNSLILISAPAGYGKTTLLTEWIGSLAASMGIRRPSICWLSLDEDDNDPTLFLNYFIGAWENEHPTLETESSALALSYPLPQMQAVLGYFINALCNVASPVWFVLDDYQAITSQVIHEGITYFLEHLPPHVHVIIATRSDPPLPLARLRARNQLVEIRADDLRFTPNEAAEFLNQTMQLSLSNEDVSTLEARTEGWIAGLQMAAVAMQGLTRQFIAEPQMAPEQSRHALAQFVYVFSGSHRYILDYLSEEVLNHQSEAVQRFLTWTSILDRFCAPLCEAVLVDPSIPSRELLAYLDKADLFLVSLDTQLTTEGDQNWYRYHRLFSDILRARFMQSQPEMVPQLHLRASVWYEQNGLMVEAIRHSLAAKDDARAAGLIEQYGPTYWSQGDMNIMMQTMYLPQEALITHPRLGIYRAWILIASGQMPAAVLLLNELRANITKKGQQAPSNWMRACIELLLAYISHPPGGNQKTPLPDLLALEAIPDEDTALHNIADFLSAILLGRLGEVELPAEILMRCIQRDESTQGTTAVPLVAPLLARTRLMQCRMREAAKLCRDYLKTIAKKGAKYFFNSGSLNIILGEVLREWNDLEGAEAQILEGIKVNESWQMVASVCLGYAALARVQETRGNVDGALNTLRKLELISGEGGKPPELEGELRALKIRLWLASGDLDRAVAWVNQFPIMHPLDPLQETDCLTVARVRLVQKNYREVQHLLEALNQVPNIEKRVNRKIKIDLLMACALAGQNQMAQALRLLEACLSLAEQEGLIRVFLDINQPMKELLRYYLSTRSSIHRNYAQKLLDALIPAVQEPALGDVHSKLVEPLTAREQEVLRLMGAGLSNRQIAENLVLSEGTIKFHMHNILEKLGVKSRTAALVRAKELKLV